MKAWARIDAFAPKNHKIIELSSDAVRWTWVVMLCDGKLQKPQGQWVSLKHLAGATGRPVAHLKELIAARLIDEDPNTGALTAHNWDLWQSASHDDPTKQERQRRYREARREELAEEQRSRRRARGDGGERRRSDGVATDHSDGQTETETETETERELASARSPARAREPKPAATLELDPEAPGYDPPGFVDFWQAWGLEQDREGARAAWARMKPPLAVVLSALAWQIPSERWAEDGGRYRPSAKNYLERKRWLDRPPPQAPPKRSEPKGFAGIREFLQQEGLADGDANRGGDGAREAGRRLARGDGFGGDGPRVVRGLREGSGGAHARGGTGDPADFEELLPEDRRGARARGNALESGD